MKTKQFKLKQKGTGIPAKVIKKAGYKVSAQQLTGFDGDFLVTELFIHTPDCWITIDLINETFSVGSYEG